jgi:hypothetical protein
LVIRIQQLEAFGRLRLEQFEEEMLGHIRAHFPEHHAAISGEQLRATIRLSHTRAGNYGMSSVRSVCIYLNCMLWLGSRFDTDLQYPWARTILTDPRLRSQRARADRLSDTSVKFVLQLAGPDNQHIAALRERLLSAGEALNEFLMRSFPAQLCEDLLPSKWELLDEEARNGLMPAGRRLAARYGMHDAASSGVYTILMFLLGSSFDTDPQFPWAHSILNTPGQEPIQKAQALIRAGLEQLKMAI